MWRPALACAVVLAAAGLGAPAASAAPTLTIVDGSGSIVSAGRAYRAAPGLRLRECDSVFGAPRSLLQVEFDDGSALTLGGEGSHFVVGLPDTQGPVEVHGLVTGWAKLTVPEHGRAAPHRLNTPQFDVRVERGTAIVHVGPNVGELFLERGSATVHARPGAGERDVVVPAGRWLAREAGASGYTFGNRATKPFLDAMPRAFRDSLPLLRKSFEGREVALVPAAGAAPDPAPALVAVPELRSCLSDASIRHAQEVLNRLGFAVGPADGIRGPRTEAALREFQGLHGLAPSGVLDAQTLRAIDIAAGSGAPEARR